MQNLVLDIINYKYTLPYYIAFGYLTILMLFEFVSINKKQSNTCIRLLTIAGFLVFFGLRGFVDTDFINYYPQFNKIDKFGDTNLFELIQAHQQAPIFWTVTSIIKSIINNYFVWIFICTLVDIWILDKIIRRYSKYYVLPFIFFFLFQGIVLEFNLIRNFKAILLFILSLKYVTERRFLPFLLTNAVGAMIHSTSLLYLPLYFIIHKKFSKKIIWCIFALGVTLYTFKIEYIELIATHIGQLMGGQIEYYVNLYVRERVYETSFIGFSWGFFERVATFLLVMYFYNKNRTSNIDRMFLNIFILYSIIYLYSSEIYVIANRLSILFVFGYWFLYPIIYSKLNSITLKYVFLAILILYAGAKISLLNSVFSRYENLLFGIDSYEERKDVIVKYFEDNKFM